MAYGVVATWQPANFGRVYAAYGGIFIVTAILWGWKVDGAGARTVQDDLGLILGVGIGHSW